MKLCRDHPSTIKKRFFSVFIVMLISPFFVYLFSSSDLFKHFTIWEVMGLRKEGLFSAFVIPLLLTMVLFLGPLSVQLTNGIWKVYSGSNDVRTAPDVSNRTFSVSIFRADVLGELLSKPSVAAQSRCGSAIGRIHVSGVHAPAAAAELFSHDFYFHHAVVLRSW